MFENNWYRHKLVDKKKRAVNYRVVRKFQKYFLSTKQRVKYMSVDLVFSYYLRVVTVKSKNKTYRPAVVSDKNLTKQKKKQIPVTRRAPPASNTGVYSRLNFNPLFLL